VRSNTNIHVKHITIVLDFTIKIKEVGEIPALSRNCEGDLLVRKHLSLALFF